MTFSERLTFRQKSPHLLAQMRGIQCFEGDYACIRSTPRKAEIFARVDNVKLCFRECKDHLNYLIK